MLAVFFDEGRGKPCSFADGLLLAKSLGGTKVRENRIVMEEVLNCSRSCRHSSAIAVRSFNPRFFCPCFESWRNVRKRIDSLSIVFLLPSTLNLGNVSSWLMLAWSETRIITSVLSHY